MPHLMLEFSSNIIEKNNLTDLFKECHQLLSTSLPTELQSCKSRSIKWDDYLIGDGNLENAFVHLTLKIMPGRSSKLLDIVGNSIMSLLKGYFAESVKKLNLQITLEIVELEKTYFKMVS